MPSTKSANNARNNDIHPRKPAINWMPRPAQAQSQRERETTVLLVEHPVAVRVPRLEALLQEGDEVLLSLQLLLPLDGFSVCSSLHGAMWKEGRKRVRGPHLPNNEALSMLVTNHAEPWHTQSCAARCHEFVQSLGVETCTHEVLRFPRAGVRPELL